ncbi:MAG TPA: hypothetical protein VGP58_11180 [Pyrinomonadaceae bacterium]|nr:hypothetical protein [Pyrinomonadaceae bacterium]
MKRLYLFLSLFVFSSVILQAQTNLKKPLKECNALLARQLVEQQADASKSVEETDKRINILLRVADFLWIADEETARKYFGEAFQIANERFREKGVEKTESKGLTVYQPDYRFNVISAVARRDAEWAKKLSGEVLKEFDEDKEKDKRGANDKDNEIRDLISIAAQTAKDNPNLALTLARRTMRYPLLDRWYFSLYQMAGNNQPLADQIYGELLTNYADAEVFRLLYLSAYPFGNGRIFGVEKHSMGMSVSANFSPNQDLQRQFLLTLLRRVMKLTSESTTKSSSQIPETAIAVMALNDLELIVAQQFPDLMQTFSQAKIHANSIVAGDALEAAKKRDESGKKFNKSFDEHLADLEKADGEGKLDEFSIFLLVSAAKTDEHFKKAESWIDKMTNEIAREGTFNYFYFQRSKLATKEKRFDEARKYALKASKIEHRAVLYFDIAEAKMKEPMTKLESLETLLEVYQTANKSPDTVEKAQVLLGLAFMFEKVDHLNALTSLADAIKTANNLENPNLFTSSVTQIIKGKNFTHFSSYSVPGFEVTETFYEMSKKDFLTTLTHATNFSDKYLRTLAVLATVKDCEKNDKPVKVKPKAKQ